MPKRSKGYISIRNCVDAGELTPSQAMDKFNQDYDLCTKCEGLGHKTSSSSDYVVEGISTVKFKDNKLLQKLDEDGKLNSEVVKKIIETVVHNRKQCDKCQGFGFVKKSRKNNGKSKT
tara:strand:+ start:126 stop:479 length:354 start_codon:yes stop_codon:yes gene_type:complete